MQLDNNTLSQHNLFWSSVSIPSHLRLRQLRDFVLIQNEKRRPKWKFRIASDLVVQMQPAITNTNGAFCYFDCLALRCADADLRLLVEPRAREGIVHQLLKFDLSASDLSTNENNGWKFNPRRAKWHSEPDLYHKKLGYTCGKKDVEAFLYLRVRLLQLFNSRLLDSLKPSLFLQPHCLLCSKALTDPVSMARMVGPECAETTSNNLPFIINPAAEG